MSEEVLVCPACRTENDVFNRTCINCGKSLIIVCPRCGMVNAITAELCLACDQQFDMLGYITARQEVRATDRFTRQANTAFEAKAEQWAKDQARTDQLWEVERQRRNKLAAQLQRRKAQEQILMLMTVVVAIIVIVILVTNAAPH